MSWRRLGSSRNSAPLSLVAWCSTRCSRGDLGLAFLSTRGSPLPLQRWSPWFCLQLRSSSIGRARTLGTWATINRAEKVWSVKSAFSFCFLFWKNSFSRSGKNLKIFNWLASCLKRTPCSVRSQIDENDICNNKPQIGPSLAYLENKYTYGRKKTQWFQHRSFL